MSFPVAAALFGGTARQVSRIATRTLRQRIAKRAAIEAEGVAKVAAVLVAEAQEVLARAVVYERARRVSWADTGKALGVSRQSVYEKYSEAERAWKSLVSTWMRTLWKLRQGQKGCMKFLAPQEESENHEYDRTYEGNWGWRRHDNS